MMHFFKKESNQKIDVTTKNISRNRTEIFNLLKSPITSNFANNASKLNRCSEKTISEYIKFDLVTKKDGILKISQKGSELLSIINQGINYIQKNHYPKEIGAHIEGLSATYEELFPLIKNPEKIKSILEIGTLNGRGTIELYNYFLNAQIITFDQETSNDPEYVDPEKLKLFFKKYKRITAVIQRLPPPISSSIKAIDFQFDLCTLDTDSMVENKYEILQFALQFKNPGGYIVINVPWATETRRARRRQFLEKIENIGLKQQKISNWIVLQ